MSCLVGFLTWVDFLRGGGCIVVGLSHFSGSMSDGMNARMRWRRNLQLRTNTLPPFGLDIILPLCVDLHDSTIDVPCFSLWVLNGNM